MKHELIVLFYHPNLNSIMEIPFFRVPIQTKLFLQDFANGAIYKNVESQ